MTHRSDIWAELSSFNPLLVVFTLLLCGVLMVPEGSRGAEPEKPASVQLQPWLVLGPVATAVPSFPQESKKATFGAAELLAAELLNTRDLEPVAGAEVLLADGQMASWRELSNVASLAPQGDGLQVAYLATYLSTDRFLNAKVMVHSHHPLRLFLGSEQLAEKKTVEKPAAEAEGGKGGGKGKKPAPVAAGEASADLALPAGKHLLWIKAVYDPAAGSAWDLSAVLEPTVDAAVSASTSPERLLSLADLLDSETITGLDLSPDGEHAAVHLQKPAVTSEHGEKWIEIYRLADDTVVRTLRGDESQFAWTPDGKGYGYVTSKDDLSSLWLADLGGSAARRVLQDVKDFETYRWMPDGQSLIFSTLEHPEADSRGVKRYRHPNDRWGGWRDRRTLYQAVVADGSRRPLTTTEEHLNFRDVSPDGSRLLLSITHYDVTQRPFITDDLYQLDLKTLKTDRLTTVTWLEAAQYSPDGKSLLMVGSPTAFGKVGVALPEGVLPNEYDNQAYIYDLATGAVDPITHDFDPSIVSATWSAADGNIYLRVTEAAFQWLYRYQPESRTFTRLDVGLEVVDDVSLAHDAARLAYYGSSATVPLRAYSLDLTGDATPRLLRGPAANFARVREGEVKDFDFQTDDGTIIGHVYYPPDFDASRKYPLIVYYYGGTSPVERDFGGRYPKELWAANGYLVYVLQPSGAFGFGQEFSARHVNNWGRTVTGEIIQGIRTFLDQHSYADSERVGCIGASYGGIMTDLLVSHTDLCKTAIAHAGITSLAGYWGHGWWGYLYSAAATAESYPWNRPDLYVEQSPLFRADQIHAPLLLLHGTDDPNVPPGQSEQLYTALQILGRNVELVTFKGQGHLILSYDLRKVWAQTIIAWFDRQLKDQPEYWQHLYGTEEEPKG